MSDFPLNDPPEGGVPSLVELIDLREMKIAPTSTLDTLAHEMARLTLRIEALDVLVQVLGERCAALEAVTPTTTTRPEGA